MLQAQCLARHALWRRVSVIYSSDESKATATARVVASQTGIAWQTRACLGELDRTAFQPPDKAAYRSAVARMLSNPDRSIRGWETRAAAERRIVTCLEQLVLETRDVPMAIISHGLVLTLLVDHLAGLMDPFEFWQDIEFASVAILDAESWELVAPFSIDPSL